MSIFLYLCAFQTMHIRNWLIHLIAIEMHFSMFYIFQRLVSIDIFLTIPPINLINSK